MVSHPEFIQTIRQFMDIAMHHVLHERIHFAKVLGLSMPQFGILMQLHHRGNCGIGDVGERFDITTAAASQLVEKLVQSGLVQRQEDPHDRRAKLLNLTGKAKELIQQNIDERYRWVDDLAGKLTAGEQAQVGEALKILTQAAREVETEESSHVPM
jgi:DNA-binding MarR family transcriptional regulator